MNAVPCGLFQRLRAESPQLINDLTCYWKDVPDVDTKLKQLGSELLQAVDRKSLPKHQESYTQVAETVTQMQVIPYEQNVSTFRLVQSLVNCVLDDLEIETEQNEKNPSFGVYELFLQLLESTSNDSQADDDWRTGLRSAIERLEDYEPPSEWPSSSITVNASRIPYSSGSVYPPAGQSSKKGLVLICNWYAYEDANDRREGSRTDALGLFLLFNALGYTVFENQIYEDLKSSDITKLLSRFGSSMDELCDSCFVVFMAHGCAENGETKILTSDGQALSVTSLREQLQTIPALEGKPKIMLFQCCRSVPGKTSNNPSTLGTDNVDPSDILPEGDDLGDGPEVTDVQRLDNNFMTIYSSCPMQYSNRDTEQGSLFISSFIQACANFSHRLEIVDIIREADKILCKKCEQVNESQKAETTSSLGEMKFYFFNPTKRTAFFEDTGFCHDPRRDGELMRLKKPKFSSCI